MKSFRLLIWLGMLSALMLASCTDDHDPLLDDPVVATLSVLDLDHPSLSSVKEELVTNGGLAASDSLNAALARLRPALVPHQGANNPVARADEIMSGFVTLSTHEVRALPVDPDWTEGSDGDPNWEFQYHSFRWTMTLLHAWVETGKQLYLDRFLFLLRDYGEDVIDADRSDVRPLAWNDMGAALRVENWLAARRILLYGNAMPSDLHLDLLRWLDKHGRLLSDEIKYVHEGNHGTFQSRAMVSLAVSAPELAASPHWLKKARERLHRQVLDLVGDDGFYRENAPQYHLMAVKNFGSVTKLLQATGGDLPEEGKRRIELMKTTIAYLVKPDGSLPMVGDSTARLPLKVYAKFSPEMQYAVSSGAEGRPPAERLVVTTEGGMAIARSGWGVERPFADESWALLDVGPRGGGHGHADALNVLYHARGADLLVDSGMYTFASGPVREAIIASPAHNVLLPDPIPEKWEGNWESELVSFHDQTSSLSVAGSTKMPGRRTWTRHLVLLEPDDLLIVDVLTGSGGAPRWNQAFRLHPNAVAVAQGDRIVVRHGDAVMELAAPGASPALHGAETDQGGWYSPAYGQRERNAVVHIIRDDATDLIMPVLCHTHGGDDSLVEFVVESATKKELRVVIVKESGRERITVDLVSGEVKR